MTYLFRNNETYIFTPAPGQWVVYRIVIGSYVYYGSTGDYKTRTSQHRTHMRGVLKGLPIAIRRYKNFTTEILTANNPVFEIIQICGSKKDALSLAKKLIQDGINVLNIAH